MRRLMTFSCEGETLAATLDEGAGGTGLLIVSGGNELRIGSHRGMAELADALTVEGVPVFRFDRRGIGDSTGENGGYTSSGPDIAAAARAFRKAVPHLTRIVAFGNCDAGTALALHHDGAPIDVLVLSNLWAFEELAADTPPPAAIKARYLERLKDPRALWRLLTGGVDIAKLAKGLRTVATAEVAPVGELAERIAQGLERFGGAVTLLSCRRDNTAILFREAWKSDRYAALRARLPYHECDSASHSYQHPPDKAWLRDRLLAAIA